MKRARNPDRIERSEMLQVAIPNVIDVAIT